MSFYTTTLPKNVFGKSVGVKTHVLTVAEMPAHKHEFNTTSSIIMNNLANPGVSQYNGSNGQLGATSMKNAGGGQAHNNIQPTISTNYIIKI